MNDFTNNDLFSKSLEKVKEIFDECQKNGKDWALKSKKYFEEEIPNIFDKLKWLNEANVHHLHSNQLVRFRGMIQDMSDPEFYMENYVVKKMDGSEQLRPGRYMDVAFCNKGEEILADSPNCVIKDRENYCCISIPGETEWVKKVYAAQNSNCPDMDDYHPVSSTANKKRSFPQEETESMDQNVSSTDAPSKSLDGKKLKEGDSAASVSNPQNASNSKDSKFPFTDPNAVICMLKVYDNDVELRLNDLVEVVGILSMDSPPVDEGLDNELEGTPLPPSLAPRLHALSIKKRLHCNPYLPPNVEKSNISNCSSNLHELLFPVLKTALLGDDLAAEYLTCHLISSVFYRQDVAPIGKFCLNLSGITPELQKENFASFLYELIENLTTHSYFLAMTLDNMNKMSFVPKKDYQENCLKSGLLQLPAHLHFIIDETRLSAGQLDASGIKNLTALGNLVTYQKVDYDFQFHTLEQHSNVPVLILSEGKAMINSDFQVRLDPLHSNVAQAFDEVSSMMSPQLSEQLRIHISLARLMPYEFSENMQKMVQEDFVSSRKHSDGLTADSLHNLLTLARLLAQSRGKMELTEDVWQKAKVMERQKKSRLPSS